MTDILLDTATGDLLMINGRLQRGSSDEQHQQLLLVFEKGALKQRPDTGVGLATYLMSNDVEGMLQMVRQEFVKDGMQVQQTIYNEQDFNLNYNASYNN